MALENEIMNCLDEIKALFDFPVFVTLVIRSDKMPNGRDIILTNDDFDQVLGAIERRDGVSLS